MRGKLNRRVTVSLYPARTCVQPHERFSNHLCGTATATHGLAGYDRRMRIHRPAIALFMLAALAAITTLAPSVANAATQVSPYHFGDSVGHRQLVAVATGAPNAEHTMVIVGCIHGNEGAGIPIIRALRAGATIANVRIWTITCVNPDGHRANTRQNARGVDLNRNFPYRWAASGSRGDTFYPGPRAASEPETRAVMRMVRALRPDITIWYHQHMNLVSRPPGAHRVALAQA